MDGPVCGIVGYTGEGQALPFLLDGLNRLEYRGYDSAGVAVLDGERVALEKNAGRVDALKKILAEDPPRGSVGIGHTRWATHGPATDVNAHPHWGCDQDFLVVHNGIIENHRALKAQLVARGHRFRSQTDTEVVAHLIEERYRTDLLEAVRQAALELEGAFALAVASPRAPGEIVGVRGTSPLLVGLGQGETYLASDVPAFLDRTRTALRIEDGELVRLTPDGAQVFTFAGAGVLRSAFQVNWNAEQAEKAGHPHFMHKEIYEEPKALRDTLSGRLVAGRVALDEGGLDDAAWQAVRSVHLVACGTAFHAALVGKALLETWAAIPVDGDVASEFRYRTPHLGPGDLCIAVSQSGETADTLAALRAARSQGAQTLAVTNVVGSSIEREADRVLHTWAGPEVAVASTKAYTTQVLVLTMLALSAAQARSTLDEAQIAATVEALARVPALAQEVLDLAGESMDEVARRIARSHDAFFIGRGLDYAVAMEGQLKLKEISYVHAEALAAGELKHGTLALIEEGTPVVAMLTQRALLHKSLSNLAEVRARGGWILGITSWPEEVGDACDRVFALPEAPDAVAPVLAALPLQLLAYHTAVRRGTDVDKPRNLAKSVTVE